MFGGACDLKKSEGEKRSQKDCWALPTVASKRHRQAKKKQVKLFFFIIFGAPVIDRCLLAKKKTKRNGNEMSRWKLCNMFQRKRKLATAINL